MAVRGSVIQAARHVTDAERRARLATRHALAPAFKANSVEAATRAVTVLHATESATVYLSCWARTESLEVADVERELFDRRSLVKQLAMRRTLFVFPQDLLHAALPSAANRVAGIERNRMAKDLVKAGLAVDGFAWLERAREEILAVLAVAPEGKTAAEIRRAVPRIDVKVGTTAEAWSAPRVLTLLGAAGEIMRGAQVGTFPTSQARWTLTSHWVQTANASRTSTDGYRELVRRWLHSFGPGTEDDIVWWLGATKGIVREALASLGAVAVSLDGDGDGDGGLGWLLPDDLDVVPDPGLWVALLPVLDPTVMGWQGRDFYLGAHRTQIFDTRGNAGTTAWVNGKVVGCWVQNELGEVRVHLLEPVSAKARKALDAEAAKLTAWLNGVRIGTGYVSTAMKAELAQSSSSSSLKTQSK